MKKLILSLLIFLPFLLNAQTKGNQEIITRTFTMDGITNLEMNLYAEVEIDASAAPALRITTDENLMNLIETEPEGNRLILTQKEWIQPSERIKIFIGGSQLERLQVSVHETVKVLDLDRPSFNAMAILGKIILEGKVDELSASGEIGAVDATRLQAREVNVNLWDRGKITLGSPEKITGKVEKDGQLIYEGNPSKVSVNTSSNGRVMSLADSNKVKNPDARFIDFKLKNNSFNRINCYVVGPKPDGSSFSYGFPMNPGQVRKKNWSIGSKVYRVTGLGTRKLLTEIKPDAEGDTVKLYGEE
jgi:hypothetical protein